MWPVTRSRSRAHLARIQVHSGTRTRCDIHRVTGSWTRGDQRRRSSQPIAAAVASAAQPRQLGASAPAVGAAAHIASTAPVSRAACSASHSLASSHVRTSRMPRADGEGVGPEVRGDVEAVPGHAGAPEHRAAGRGG